MNIALRESAREAGLCDEWFSQWGDDDTIEDCLDRAVRGHDFLQDKDWPPLAFIREHFADRRDALHRHHIFLDEQVGIVNAKSGYYIFLGDCRGKVEVGGMHAVTVFVRHSSNIDVLASEGAKVFVTYYDKSEGLCCGDGWSYIRSYDKRKH